MLTVKGLDGDRPMAHGEVQRQPLGARGNGFRPLVDTLERDYERQLDDLDPRDWTD